jgi:Tol biopolymer transport system component
VRGLVILAASLALTPAAHAAASTRVLYASDWSGHMEIYAVDPSGKAPVGQLTFGVEGKCGPFLPCGFIDPVPSPDGRMVVYGDTGDDSLWVARADGSAARLLTAHGSAPAWSPDSRRIAYSGTDGIHVVDANGKTDRLVAAGLVGDVGWSHDRKSLLLLDTDYRRSGLYLIRTGGTRRLDDAVGYHLHVSRDGRWIATTWTGGKTVYVFHVGNHNVVPVATLSDFDAAWSPDSRRLAIESQDGIRVFDVRTHRTRLLTRDVGVPSFGGDYGPPGGLGMAWAPDGRSLAYVMGGIQWNIVLSGELKTVTLTGKTRTLVPADQAYGGRIVSLAWNKTPAVSYRAPEPESTQRVTSDSVLADGQIYRLAADGTRVVFISCDGVFAWTPTAENVTPVHEGALPTSCSFWPDLELYDVAVAGDRVAYATSAFCNDVALSLYLVDLAHSASANDIAGGYVGACGGPLRRNIGELAAAGDLLVYGDWRETSGTGVSPFPITGEEIHRVDGDACPCPTMASSPGPLYPADVNEDRVVAYGTNETRLFDRNGNPLLSLPVSPLAAQLAGTDLVLLLPGELRDYDARSGALLHTWPVPKVSSGPVCAVRVLP